MKPLLQFLRFTFILTVGLTIFACQLVKTIFTHPNATPEEREKIVCDKYLK